MEGFGKLEARVETGRVASINHVHCLFSLTAECLEPSVLRYILLPRPEFQRTLAQLVRALLDRNLLENIVKQMVASCRRVILTDKIFFSNVGGTAHLHSQASDKGRR